MVKHTFTFVSKHSIIEFLSKYYINHNKEILLQIFTCNNNYEYIKNLQDVAKEFFPNAKIIGSSASGVISNCGTLDNETLFSISIFDKTKIEISTSKITLDSYNLGKELIENFDKDNLKNSKVLIAFAEGLKTNGEEFLKGINDKAPEILVAGGMAADNISFDTTYVFTKDEIIDNGAVGAILINPRATCRFPQTTNNLS